MDLLGGIIDLADGEVRVAYRVNGTLVSYNNNYSYNGSPRVCISKDIVAA